MEDHRLLPQHETQDQERVRWIAQLARARTSVTDTAAQLEAAALRAASAAREIAVLREQLSQLHDKSDGDDARMKSMATELGLQHDHVLDLSERLVTESDRTDIFAAQLDVERAELKRVIEVMELTVPFHNRATE